MFKVDATAGSFNEAEIKNSNTINGNNNCNNMNDNTTAMEVLSKSLEEKDAQIKDLNDHIARLTAIIDKLTNTK